MSDKNELFEKFEELKCPFCGSPPYACTNEDTNIPEIVGHLRCSSPIFKSRNPDVLGCPLARVWCAPEELNFRAPDALIDAVVAASRKAANNTDRDHYRTKTQAIPRGDDALGVMLEAKLILQAAGVELEPPYSVESPS